MHNSRVIRVVRVVGAGLVIGVFAGAAMILPACETVKGAGKDVQNVGQAGSDAIDSAAGKKK